MGLRLIPPCNGVMVSKGYCAQTGGVRLVNKFSGAIGAVAETCMRMKINQWGPYF